jgi:hypothetical protein
MRRILAGLLLFAAVSAALVAVVLLSSGSSVDHTIENSRRIAATLEAGRVFVDSFLAQHGRLPNPTEFEEWSSVQADEVYGARNLRLSVADFSPELIAEFGPPGNDAYSLSLWRGEWDEHYASWARRTSLIFDRSAYFVFGSPLRDAAVPALISVGLFLAARTLWRRAAQQAAAPDGRGLQPRG